MKITPVVSALVLTLSAAEGGRSSRTAFVSKSLLTSPPSSLSLMSRRRRRTALNSAPSKENESEVLPPAPFFASFAGDLVASMTEPVMNEPQAGRSSDDIAKELSSGIALDGGPVVDFGSIKDTSSRAERALESAKNKFLASRVSGITLTSTDESGRLMGINDDVVREVGHEIGEFVGEYAAAGQSEAEVIQRCAAYLRSKAGADTFSLRTAAAIEADAALVATFTAEEKGRFDALLRKSYEESGVVTAAFAKTFYLGTQVLPEPAMEAIWAVYVWCRRTDEIVDAPRPKAADPDAEMLADLSEWEIRLDELFGRGEAVDVLDLPLLDCKARYPALPIEPFADMIRGMLMDIPGLGQDRYETWDELHLYCYRVAGTVGLMSMPVFGCAPGYTAVEAKEPALSLGVAFQITNILRDVGEDATTRQRVYLPRIDMQRFGVTEQQIMDQIVDDNYVRLMKFEIARARMYYARALRGVAMLRPESRLPVQLSLDAYGRILDKIEENGYDSLTKRAYVGKWEKMAGVPFSWYRTLDVAKVLPIPGDENRPTLEQLEILLKALEPEEEDPDDLSEEELKSLLESGDDLSEEDLKSLLESAKAQEPSQ